MTPATTFWVVVFCVIVALLVLFAWRQRRHPAQDACPRCRTPFDLDTWKIENRRRHYKSRYTITPVFVCPQCGYEMSPTDEAN
jgi:hypothetical protein